MGGITDALFGGSARDAARAQTAATEQAMLEYKKGVNVAKSEIGQAFPEATDARRMGTQQAMDVMGMGLRPSLEATEQGNLNAQRTMANAAPQMQNAILGGNVDYGFMNPQSVDFNTSAFLKAMPDVYDPNNTAASQGNSFAGLGASPVELERSARIQELLKGFIGREDTTPTPAINPLEGMFNINFAPSVSNTGGTTAFNPTVSNTGGTTAFNPTVSNTGGTTAFNPTVSNTGGSTSFSPTVSNTGGSSTFNPAVYTPPTNTEISLALQGLGGGASIGGGVTEYSNTQPTYYSPDVRLF